MEVVVIVSCHQGRQVLLHLDLLTEILHCDLKTKPQVIENLTALMISVSCPKSKRSAYCAKHYLQGTCSSIVFPSGNMNIDKGSQCPPLSTYGTILQ